MPLISTGVFIRRERVSNKPTGDLEQGLKHRGIAGCDGGEVTSVSVTTILTFTICDKVASGLKVEVTHDENRLCPGQHG